MPTKSASTPKSVSSPSPKIAVFLGGNSPERPVSLRSGRAVAAALKKAGYQVVMRDPARLSGERLTGGIDAAFIALHGAGGEDGPFQRLLEKKKLPYTGSGPTACRISFDKQLTKRRLVEKGIPTPGSALIDRRNWERVAGEFETPFFVKPLRDGSSLGVFCVHDLQKSRPVIKKALQKYGHLLIEKRISGREFTVGILGGRALPVIELKPKGDFYDYHCKYTRGMCRYLVPAPISPSLSRKLQKTALKVHKALELRDMSRVDFMVDVKGRAYVLEANAIPGFTALSLLPKAAGHAGISFEELCSRLVGMALGRKRKKTR